MKMFEGGKLRREPVPPTKATSDSMRGTSPSIPPERLRGAMPSQTSQTEMNMPKKVPWVLQRRGEGGEDIRGISVPAKSSFEKPRNYLQSQTSTESQENVTKIPKISTISKIKNLKLFWEKKGGQDREETAKPKFCGANGSEAVPHNIVQANDKI